MKRFSRVGRVRWFAIVVIVAAMLVSAIAVFAATTVIDSFGGGTQSLTANFGSTVDSSDASTVAAIGGIRNVQATYTVGDGDVRIVRWLWRLPAITWFCPKIHVTTHSCNTTIGILTCAVTRWSR